MNFYKIICKSVLIPFLFIKNNLLFGFIYKKKKKKIDWIRDFIFDLKESFSILLELKNNNNKWIKIKINK